MENSVWDDPNNSDFLEGLKKIKSDTFCVTFRSSLPVYANGEIGIQKWWDLQNFVECPYSPLPLLGRHSDILTAETYQIS